MNLDFVEKPQDREELVRLLTRTAMLITLLLSNQDHRTGNSRLLQARDRQKSAVILQGLGSHDYLESCSYLGEEDLKTATKGRSDKILRECLAETIKAGNGTVGIFYQGLNHFLKDHQPIFQQPLIEETGDTALHVFFAYGKSTYQRNGRPLSRSLWKQLVCLSDLRATNTSKQTGLQMWRPNVSAIPTDLLEKVLLYDKLHQRDPQFTVLL